MSQDFTNNIRVLNSASKATIVLNADTPRPAELKGGTLYLSDPDEKFSITLSGGLAALHAGGNGHKGSVALRNGAGKDTVKLGGGDTGDLYLCDQDANFTIALRAVENKVAGIWVGGKGQAGLTILRNGAGKDTVSLGGGDTGDLYLCDQDGNFTIALRAVENNTSGIWVGGQGQSGLIVVRNSAGSDSVVLDGEAGDLSLVGADCAEEFDITETEQIDPGCVVVLTQDGKLRQSTHPYDRKVAGIISGAGKLKPGIVLDRQRANQNRRPLAMMGKAYCKACARSAPIEAGDLLTTSATPGHAMKATDEARAFGAVLGKALLPLNEGQGLIPVLVMRH